MSIKELKNCRICNNSKIEDIIDLGNLAITGIFPSPGEIIDYCPLILCRCEICGLVQLRHTYSLDKMYGDQYGYHSNLNNSMVNHLKGLVRDIEDKVSITDDDIILDIGSNDATLLKQYKQGIKIGVDPTIKKFKEYYSEDIQGFAEFFPSENLTKFLANNKVKVITSIACFYDLEEPIKFAQEIAKILSLEGIWVTEQSYLPSMIRNLSYDTICHEHLEYYGLNQIKYIADRAGLKIIDVSFDDTNGGSFKVILALKSSTLKENKDLIDIILYLEKTWNSEEVFNQFEHDVYLHKEKIKFLLKNLKMQGKNISGYGASTKGNVLLQFCDINSSQIDNIVEINEDKFGKVTPGSNIPIIQEDGTNEINYYFVLPWHFKENILKRNKNKNVKFIFPLPKLEVI